MRVSVCAPGLAGLRAARGCQLAAGLLPPAPLLSPAGPPSCPACPSPAGQALGRPGGAGGGGELGSPGLRAAGGARAEPPPLGPAAPAPLPAGPRPVKLCCCGRRGGERSSPASGREGRRAGRGRRGARSAAAPARGPTMPQLGGGGGGGGSGGSSGAGATGGGDDLGANDELIPFQDEGGEEQEPSSDSASAQRDLDEVKSSLVNESENQSSSSDSEVRRLRRPTPRTPARRPLTRPRLCVSSAGGEAPAARSGRLPEAAGLFHRRYVPARAAPVPGPRGARRRCWGRPRFALAWRCPCSLPVSAAAVLGRAWGALGSRGPCCGVVAGAGSHPVLVLPAVRRPQDGTFFKGPPYPGYPFLMIPDLSSPYLPNGPLSPGGARTVSACPAAPGRVGGPAGGMRPGARRRGGGWGRPGRIPGRTCLRS